MFRRSVEKRGASASTSAACHFATTRSNSYSPYQLGTTQDQPTVPTAKSELLPRTFPALKLVLPPLVPLVPIALQTVSQGSGDMGWGCVVHLSVVVVFAYELLVLPKAVAALREPTNDTALNRACVWFAGLFCAAFVVWLVSSIVVAS